MSLTWKPYGERGFISEPTLTGTYRVFPLYDWRDDGWMAKFPAGRGDSKTILGKACPYTHASADDAKRVCEEHYAAVLELVEDPTQENTP